MINKLKPLLPIFLIILIYSCSNTNSTSHFAKKNKIDLFSADSIFTDSSAVDIDTIIFCLKNIDYKTAEEKKIIETISYRLYFSKPYTTAYYASLQGLNSNGTKTIVDCYFVLIDYETIPGVQICYAVTEDDNEPAIDTNAYWVDKNTIEFKRFVEEYDLSQIVSFHIVRDRYFEDSKIFTDFKGFSFSDLKICD